MQFCSAFLLVFLAFVSALFSYANAGLVYSDTLLCASHKTKFCFTYSETLELFVLTKDITAFARFDITTSGSDPAKLLLKSNGLCVTEASYLSYTALTLAPCSSGSNLYFTFSELDLETNSFTLETYSSEPSCVSLAYKSSPNKVSVTKKRVQLHTNVPVILETCKADYSYGQTLATLDFDTSTVSLKNEITISTLKKLTKSSSSDEPRFGFYCLVDKPELCLGVSLTNGTDLESDKFVQVKNLTKNSVKELEKYKLEWFRNYVNSSSEADEIKVMKLANAAELEYCLEALYDAYTGDNRPGISQYDNVLHLGFCDDLKKNNSVSSDNLTTRAASQNIESEIFSLVPKTVNVNSEVVSYMEMQTVKPSTNEVYCATVVKCVYHDNDHCVPYSSVEAETVDQLTQGAHVRLKTCDSERLVSQRFFYTPDYEATDPPIYVPTPEPTVRTTTLEPTVFPTNKPTKQPTQFPTNKPTTTPPTSSPTSVPKTGEDKPPTSTDSDPSTITTKNSPVTSKSWFKGVLSIIGIICFIIIILGIIYYKKQHDDESSTRSGSYAGVPSATTDNANFVARV